MIASQVVVLVPVLNRPHRVKPLMKSFEASGTPEARLLFIVEEGDEEELDALLMADAQMLVVEPECTTWPHKVNRGYKETADPWLLLAADDVHFHPGWWRATESARQKFGVIGTNDLGNPHVLAGKLVETAKIRNQWAFCPDAIVEHLHPYWDPTVHWDSTYARGEAHRHQDQELFRSRHASLLQWAHTG
jgi:hypothetical protein